MRAALFTLLMVGLGGCAATDGARSAYVRAGTSKVTETFEETCVTSEDGRTMTKRSKRVTESYSSPALEAAKALGGIAGKVK